MLAAMISWRKEMVVLLLVLVSAVSMATPTTVTAFTCVRRAHSGHSGFCLNAYSGVRKGGAAVDVRLGGPTGGRNRKGGVQALGMALKFKRRKQRNTLGEFFVDESCVDCDICRWMDPRTYGRSGLGAVVTSQPIKEEDRLQAFRAMLACPTGSIRTMRPDMLVEKAMDSYPLAVDEERLPEIYQLAPTTSASLGTTPYLIVRPEKGNIMVDVPRYLDRTADRMEALGGVKYLIVTARDNAIGHERWKTRFPDMIRVLHRTDLTSKTRIMEERLDGDGPWHLVKAGRGSATNGWITGATARFDFVDPKSTKRRAAKDKMVKIIHAPGVTRGSVAVIYELERPDGTSEKIGFSGGTVGLASYKKRLYTFPKLKEESQQKQEFSIRKLAKEGITTLLPGRGAKVYFDSTKESKEALEAAADSVSSLGDLASHPLLG